ncbi:hypothetical protein HPT29_028530 (plasmid) [Microvirga terrae]|uniref:Uncharacterized protein n=1 Tax=Microvirga terrae TaxID=2740529 RepID=A0ABY5S027_9HYPH|nr:hypothetical protein [Microvirga terrae]UVF22850.1 hypothetical protein HPT29_028530 [Microvirga terrae]
MTTETAAPTADQAETYPFTGEQALARLSVLETLAINNAIVVIGMVADAEGLTTPELEKHLTHLRDTTVNGVARFGREDVTDIAAKYADAVFKGIFDKVNENKDARERAAQKGAATPPTGKIQ